MPKYLACASYTGEGVTGLLREGGTKRREAVEASLGELGASVEAFYYAFGETDVYGIVDFPDEATAAAWSLTVNSTGAVRLHFVPLIEPEALDRLSERSVAFRAPGT